MIQHDPYTIVVCNVCLTCEYEDDNAITSRLLLASAKQAGWKRRIVRREEHGHQWRDTEDVCPACQAKETQTGNAP